MTSVKLDRAQDREAVTIAAREIDRVLADAPLTHGKSQGEDLRIIFVTPLGARYLVGSEDLQVGIVQFWTF